MNENLRKQLLIICGAVEPEQAAMPSLLVAIKNLQQNALN